MRHWVEGMAFGSLVAWPFLFFIGLQPDWFTLAWTALWCALAFVQRVRAA